MRCSQSHNANVSDGWMYPTDVDQTTGRPIDAAWAESRMRNERLIEIKQGKGQSKRIPVVAQRRVRKLRDVPDHPRPAGRRRPYRPHPRQLCAPGAERRYRDAGPARLQPYRFGMAGGSDSHNSASAYRHDNFFGMHGRRTARSSGASPAS